MVATPSKSARRVTGRNRPTGIATRFAIPRVGRPIGSNMRGWRKVAELPASSATNTPFKLNAPIVTDLTNGLRFLGGPMRLSPRKPTHDLPIRELEPPQQVHISLRQVLPLVQPGLRIEHGQLLAATGPDAKWQSYRHSPLQGQVVEIVSSPGTQQSGEPHLVIDGQVVPRTQATHRSSEEIDPTAVLDAICRAGIVGMGGAMFPTYAKFVDAGAIDWVLVNGCESEPYLSCDHRVLMEHREDVECGMRLAMHVVGASNGAIVSREAKYPDGYEPLLIRSVLGREIPPGGLPRDVGVVVINVQTARAIHDAICGQRPLVDRVLSVAGGAILRPGNYVVPLGTKVGHVLTVCGVDWDRAECLIAGGPMMGHAVTSQHVVTAGTGAILALTAEESALHPSPEPCIRCGECQAVCPLSLAIVSLIRHPQTAVLRCVECGGCEYQCPSQRPLVALLRQAKVAVADMGREA